MAANHVDELIPLRTPYLWSYSRANLIAVTVDVYIWNGDEVSDKPLVPTFGDKRITAIDEQAYFDLAKLCRDWIEVEYAQNSESECVFIEVQATYDDGITDSGAITTEKYTGFDGFYYTWEGISSGITNDVLQTSLVVYVPQDTIVYVPVLARELDNVLNYYDANPNGSTLPPLYTKDITGDYDSTPSNTNDYIYYLSNTTNNSGTEYRRFVEVQWGLGARSTTIEFRYFDCNRYEPIKCVFVNKYGAKQTLFFQGRLNFNYDISSGEQFKRNTLDLDTLTYDIKKGQTVKPNVNGTQKITANTGWITEADNAAINEMVLSEQCWMVIPENAYGFLGASNSSARDTPLILPCIPTISNHSVKDHLSEKLINYTLDFDVAFNILNTVR